MSAPRWPTLRTVIGSSQWVELWLSEDRPLTDAECDCLAAYLELTIQNLRPSKKTQALGTEVPRALVAAEAHDGGEDMIAEPAL